MWDMCISMWVWGDGGRTYLEDPAERREGHVYGTYLEDPAEHAGSRGQPQGDLRKAREELKY